VSATSRMSQRVTETCELLERLVIALCLAILAMTLACVVVLLAAATFGILHPGDDFDFGQRHADVVLPAHLS